MPIVKTLAFGRMWRYECDGADCGARISTLATAPSPIGWDVGAPGRPDAAYCPSCRQRRAAEDLAATNAARGTRGLPPLALDELTETALYCEEHGPVQDAVLHRVRPFECDAPIHVMRLRDMTAVALAEVRSWRREREKPAAPAFAFPLSIVVPARCPCGAVSAIALVLDGPVHAGTGPDSSGKHECGGCGRDMAARLVVDEV